MNWRTSWVVVLFAFIQVFVVSCSSIEFTSGGKTRFKISAGGGSERLHEIEGTADFYFWGTSPKKQIVDLDDHANRLGLEAPGFVSVEERIGLKSMFLTFVTLGLYSPVDYKIVLLAKKGDVH